MNSVTVCDCELTVVCSTACWDSGVFAIFSTICNCGIASICSPCMSATANATATYTIKRAGWTSCHQRHGVAFQRQCHVELGWCGFCWKTLVRLNFSDFGDFLHCHCGISVSSLAQLASWSMPSENAWPLETVGDRRSSATCIVVSQDSLARAAAVVDEGSCRFKDFFRVSPRPATVESRASSSKTRESADSACGRDSGDCLVVVVLSLLHWLSTSFRNGQRWLPTQDRLLDPGQGASKECWQTRSRLMGETSGRANSALSRM